MNTGDNSPQLLPVFTPDIINTVHAYSALVSH